LRPHTQDTAATLNVYLLIIYTGFNSLTNMGYGLLIKPLEYPLHTPGKSNITPNNP